MCLIVLAFHVHPSFPLIVAANRDEFLARPTAPASFWADAPSILAGRDLAAGGTWLGVAQRGRFAAITNYRDLRKPRPAEPRSRGGLVVRALRDRSDPVATEGYDGFNLLYGTADGLRYHNNIDGTTVPLAPGVHGLSNHLLNTPWPKVERAKEALAKAVAAEEPDMAAMFSILTDRTPARDNELPDTGLDIGRERALSCAFIATADYGTRCSTVVFVANDGRITFEERTWLPVGTVRHTFATSP